MLGANLVVRAEASKLDCIAEMPVDLAPNFYQAAQCPLGIRRAGVKQDAITGISGVDPLTNRGRRVAALQRNLRDQQMRERVQHHVWSANEIGLRVWILLLPQLEAFRQFDFPLRNFTPFTPGANLFGFEGDKDSLAAVFYGRNPVDLIGQRGAIHANGEFTIDVIGRGLEARESDQRNDFAQAVDENDTVDLVPDSLKGRCRPPAARVEIAFDFVLANLVRARE